ncbi:MAG: N-acylneuraminate-9-phosphate synthase [Halobacteriovoraceae bacterium]|nr:N-acylneuraminate-9-phosphate synthase [Halobacteriovoraceae bacterium]
MRKMTLKNSRVIGDNEKPYIIAEVNSSHNGDIEVAKEMIRAAKDAECDCVKFQSWSPESINSKNFYEENPIAKRFYKKFALTGEQLIEVAQYCKELGMDFSSTPYSREEVDFLINDCQAPFVKIASMELNNLKYIEYIAKTGTPVVLSTGMGDIEEVRKAVEVIKATGNTNLCILHCISIYPPEIETIRLNNILGLQEEFPQYAIGFSDHSIGVEIPTAAIALGACLIEKHLTLDKNKIGMDNQVAAEPEEMKEMVKNCHNVYKALGGKDRIVMDAELEQRTKMRRSVIASRDLKAGETIALSDLDVKRPGTGIAPELMDSLVGKVLARDVEADKLVSMEDFN